MKQHDNLIVILNRITQHSKAKQKYLLFHVSFNTITQKIKRKFKVRLIATYNWKTSFIPRIINNCCYHWSKQPKNQETICAEARQRSIPKSVIMEGYNACWTEPPSVAQEGCFPNNLIQDTLDGISIEALFSLHMCSGALELSVLLSLMRGHTQLGMNLTVS